MWQMIVIDDDKASCLTLELHFGDRGFNVATANSAEAAFDLIDEMLFDIRMLGGDGFPCWRKSARITRTFRSS